MRSWLHRRRERLERIEAEALIGSLGIGAYSAARQREREASSEATAKDWSRIASAVAPTRRFISEDPPVAQFRIQFFGVPTGRRPTILGEVDLLASDALTAMRQAAHATWPPLAIGFCLIDRNGCAVFGRRKTDRW
jgi:hypothetical protein